MADTNFEDDRSRQVKSYLKRNRKDFAARNSDESMEDTDFSASDSGSSPEPARRRRKRVGEATSPLVHTDKSDHSPSNASTYQETDEDGDIENSDGEDSEAQDLVTVGDNADSDADNNNRIISNLQPVCNLHPGSPEPCNLIEEADTNADSKDSGEESQSGDDGKERASEASDRENKTDSQSDSEAETMEEEADFLNDGQPIYNGAKITLKESLLAILCFVLSHKLTGQCVNDLLSLIELHCAPQNQCLKTLYKFRKYFKLIGKNFVKCHYFCLVCEMALPSKDAVCETCNQQQGISYFIELPIITQLQSMFKREGFHDSLGFRFNRNKKSATNIEDIYDGLIYKNLMSSGFLANPNNVSFFMYFDGVSLFKSSSFSIWPVYLTINELPYSQRTKKENIILSGLWFGKSKPNPNLFLQPLTECMASLEINGTDVTLPNNQNLRVRAKLLGAVGDLPAKALFMRFVQFNGTFSCFNCLAKGGRFNVGRTTVQVFPYSRNIELRNKEDTINFGEQAIIAHQNDPNAAVYGVKGPSLLSVLLLGIILSMGIDVMHGVFLGVMRTLMHLWFDSQYSAFPFSISALAHLVDARLKDIKPPVSFKVPRSIKKEFALMKAVDFKIFMFYYSLPVLLGILSQRYWFHHCKLVSAVGILCKESIALEEIETAEALLHSYVSDFQELYSLRHLSLTFHQLLHLPLVVRHLGPAWVYSCFSYESLNGQFARLIHGARHVALQISSSCSVYLNLSVMINSMNEGLAKTLCLKLQGGTKRQLKITVNIDHQTAVVGALKTCDPVPLEYRRLIQNKFHVDGGSFTYFYRLKRKGTVYHSVMYQRSKNKLSCFVEVREDETPLLGKINSFVSWSPCVCRNLFCDCGPKLYLCFVTMNERVPWELHDAPQIVSPSHLHKVEATNMNVFSVDKIKCACVLIPADGKEYIACPINCLEVE